MKKYCFLFLLILGLVLQNAYTPSPLYAAGVREVVVQGKGTGKTREEAINAALVEAISQVHGVDVASRSATDQKILIQSDEVDEGGSISSQTQIQAGQSSRQDIQTQTQGSVKNYTIISEEASTLTPGNIDVILSATILTYQGDNTTKRKRIAVMPFKLSDTNLKNDFGDLLSKEIVNYLTQTRRLAILDRDYLDEKHMEFDRILGDDVPIEERARIGNTLATDYMLVGTVLYTEPKKEVKTNPYTNAQTVIFHLEAGLSWRLIEAATGQIMLSKNTFFKQTSPKTVDTRWTFEAVAQMGEEVARDIVDNIYPLMPVAYKNNRLTIPQGGETVAIGQQYIMIKYGDIIYDPYTGEAIGRDETHVGKVEIIQVSPKLSYAKIVDTILSDAELIALKERQYILRPFETPKGANGKPKQEPVQTQQPAW